MIVDQVFSRAQSFGDRLRDTAEVEGAKWSDQKARCMDLADQVGKVAITYGRELALCALRLDFRDHEDGGKSVKKWSSCNRRWCPVCAWRKSKMRYLAVLRNLPGILAANKGSRFAMWTFTVRNCRVDELSQVTSLMAAAFRRLTLRPSFPITGYVRALEITFPREGEAHPHYHVVVSRDRLGRFPSHADLVAAWRECLRIDYDPIVEAHMVRVDKSGCESVLKALSQVLKYSIKPMNELPYATWAIPAVAALKGVRFVASGGIFKELFAEEENKPEQSPVVESRAYAYQAEEREYRREVFNG